MVYKIHKLLKIFSEIKILVSFLASSLKFCRPGPSSPYIYIWGGEGDHPQGGSSFSSICLTLNESNKKQNNYLQKKLFGSASHFVPRCGKTKWPTNHELQVCCLDQPPEGCFWKVGLRLTKKVRPGLCMRGPNVPSQKGPQKILGPPL